MSTKPETLVIVNTSPLLYLYQVNCLELLQQLYSTITVPPAVPQELETGKRQGVDEVHPNFAKILGDWKSRL